MPNWVITKAPKTSNALIDFIPTVELKAGGGEDKSKKLCKRTKNNQFHIN